jgi:GNAT superfamily N-acetyltransferase
LKIRPAAEGGVVWVEALFVDDDYRRRGIGGELYAEAERIALALGGNPPYNWVDPNNVQSINFLKKCGYNVLNLIELRQPHPGEVLAGKISVGAQEFECH